MRALTFLFLSFYWLLVSATCQEPMQLKESLYAFQAEVDKIQSIDYDYELSERKNGEEFAEAVCLGRVANDRRIKSQFHEFVVDARPPAVRLREITKSNESAVAMPSKAIEVERLANGKKDAAGQSGLHHGGYLAVDDKSLSFPAQSDSGYLRHSSVFRPVDRQRRIREPFDFRAIGFAFIADYMRNVTFEEAMSGVFTWGECKAQGDPKTGIVTYDTVLSIDPNRGHWAVGHSTSGSKATVSLRKVNEAWVPEKMVLKGPEKTIEMNLRWRSVNELPDMELYNFDNFAKKFPRKIWDQYMSTVPGK